MSSLKFSNAGQGALSAGRDGGGERASAEGAAQVARQSPAAVRYCKELIQGGRDQPINTLLARARERFVDLFELEDTVEGVNAFLEKRPPQWTRR